MSEVSSRVTLTSFVPRQVMIEKATNATAAEAAAASSKDDNPKKKKRKDETVVVMEIEDEGKKSKKKKSSKISNAGEYGSGSMETLALDRPSGDAIPPKGKGREDLLRSIAAFLEGSGFVKTLSVFRLEAQIEVNSRGGYCFNLEDLFDKFIELSKIDPIASIDWSKEHDVQTIDKKRKIKQVSDSSVQENSEIIFLDTTFGTEENTDYEKPLKVVKKKKHKVIPGENAGEVVANEKNEELKDLTTKPNVATGEFEKEKGEKKKKKKKEAKQLLEQSGLGVNQKVIAKKPDDEAAYASAEHRDSVNPENLVDNLPENVDGSRMDKKKNKNEKLENTADVEMTTNKKRKKSSLKETAIHVENLTEAGISKMPRPEVAKEEKETFDHKVLTCSEPSRLNQESEEPSKVLSSVVLDKHEENANLRNPEKKLSKNQLANGSIGKHQKEESIEPKSMKKEKHSGEPKVLNAFQRVKVDDVQFANKRLQDNSYWALDDSGSGYGAKAQEVLGQVKGRDFRHEKTKKKRGTYRGGQIDLQSHSIKFNYSDDE